MQILRAHSEGSQPVNLQWESASFSNLPQDSGKPPGHMLPKPPGSGG